MSIRQRIRWWFYDHPTWRAAPYWCVVAVLVVALLVLANAADAAPSAPRTRWYSVANVDRAALTVEYLPVDGVAMRAIERQWTGAEPEVNTLAISRLIKRTAPDGTVTWHCTIAHDARATRSAIRHELQHCYGYDHHLT